MPQNEGAAFCTRWLYGGTTYRRMVEPLAIAQCYKDGGKDYVNKERSKHFKNLEEWLNKVSPKVKKELNSTSKKNVEVILKDNEELLKNLVEFEDYVYGLLKDYAVSPEIFLSQSSYMSWWKDYIDIKGSSYTSKLANFMNDAEKIKLYGLGAYDFF
ncbi:senescence-associated carboxylesterase [Trifolium repens]|nr:senescence-associated carboxylesterase [Trifolium repens]